MAGENTFSTMTGVFTEQYAPTIQSVVPDYTVIAKSIPFMQGKKLGNLYHFPVELTQEAGFTYNSGAGAYNLNAAINSVFADAQIQGSVLWHSVVLTQEAFLRSQGGVKQYETNVGKMKMKSAYKSMGRRLDVSLLYGQSDTGIGQVGVSSASGTTYTAVISAETFAPGIFHGADGALFDVFATIGSASATNATASLILTGVDEATRTLTFTCASADATALNALGTSANPVLFYAGVKTGASSFIEMKGIEKALQQTSGSLYNVATTYSLWKGRSKAIGGNLSFSELQKAIVSVVNTGVSGKLMVLVSPITWAFLMNDQAALVRFPGDKSHNKLANGYESLELHSQGFAGTSILEIVPASICKNGRAYILNQESWFRIGSTEPTFDGADGETMFYKVPSTNYFRADMMTDQAIATNAPAQNMILTGITNT